MRIRLVALAAALLAGCSTTDTAGPADDLRALVRFIEHTHPRPYTYVPAASFAALVDAEAARLEALAQPTELELGRSLHRVLARLGDGHFAVALPTFQPDAGPLSLLPLLPKRAGATVYVDASTPALPPGTELLAIDGVAIDELWSTLAEHALADGDRPTIREAALERNFGRHYHLVHGLHDRYRVRVRRPGGDAEELELTGIDRAPLAALAGQRHSAPIWGPAPAPDQPPWPFVVSIDADTTLLRLASFGVPEPDEYQRRVDAIFAALPPAHTLVLDLRGNEGGLRTHGIAVLNHLLARPYTQWTGMAARVRRIPAEHRAHVEFPFVPEDALTARFPAEPAASGRFEFTGDPLADRMRPTAPRHTGKLVVFVDAATNSAAVEMLTALLAHGTATVIGVETGGECGRHVGEMPVVYTTPDHAIAVLMSLIELTHVPVPGCEPGRGHLPDRPISYDEQDFLAGRDPYLAELAAL